MSKKDTTVEYDLSDFTGFKRQCERVRTEIAKPSVNIIREYDTDGKFIKMWPNIKNIAETEDIGYFALRTHIRKGVPLTINDKIFLEGSNDIKDRLTTLQKEAEKKALVEYAKNSKQVMVYTSDGIYVDTFDSPKKASNYTGVSTINIQNSLIGKALVTGGFIFMSVFDDIKERMTRIKNRKTWKTNN
jgi:hypothetical protein